jgi:citronellol/citronellal dehydrogenase
MIAAEPIDLLRPALLSGTSMLVAGPLGAPAGSAVLDAARTLGARVFSCEPSAADEVATDAAVRDAVGRAGRISLLAVDGAGLFAQGLARDGEGHAALRACMDSAWNVTRAVVNNAFLAGGAQPSAGRIVYIAPASHAALAPSADPAPGVVGAELVAHAGAACAGLENLARTLSIEWARHAITTVTLAQGTHTSPKEIGSLVAYLASPAGAYFSGCLLDLRGP